jgi:hypothetical protein
LTKERYMQPASTSHPDDRVWSREIRRREGIGDRGFRKWIASGRFPPPDGNFCGRDFWLRSTYERWRADVLEGRYHQQRKPVAKAA